MFSTKKKSSALGTKMSKIVDKFKKMRSEMSDIIKDGTADIVNLNEEQRIIEIEKDNVKSIVDMAAENLKLLPDFKTPETKVEETPKEEK